MSDEQKDAETTGAETTGAETTAADYLSDLLNGDSSKAPAAPRELRSAARIKKVMSATPQGRVARMLKWADAWPCASEEARSEVDNQSDASADEFAELLERGDCAGLERAMSAFRETVIAAAAIVPPRPSLLPSGDTFLHFGWRGEEREALQTVLLYGLLGVKKGDGDYVVSIDEKGATTAKGLRFSREQIFAATRPVGEGGVVEQSAGDRGVSDRGLGALGARLGLRERR
jgi:hypothetical protein